MAKKKNENNGYFNIFNVGDILVQPEEAIEEPIKETQEHFFSIANIVEETQSLDEDSAQITMFNSEESEIAPNDDVFNAEAIIDEDAFVDEDVDENDEEITEEVLDESLEEDNEEVFEEFAEETVEETVLEEYSEEIIEEIDEEIIEVEPIQEFFVEEVVATNNETTIEPETAVEEANEEPVEEVNEEATTDEADSDEPITDEVEDASVVIAEENQEEEMLVSMLETNMLDEEITEEIFVGEYENIKEITAESFEDLPDFKQIKKQKEFESFETAYVYHGKNGDRIRYRLQLPTDKQKKRTNTIKSIFGWTLTVVLALVLAMVLRSYVFLVATVDGPSMQPTLKTNDRLLVTRFTYALTDIKRGDVVICRYDSPLYPDMYVKRVIGLPGETISIVEGIVCINGAPIYEDYTFPATESNKYYNMEPYEIPTDHVFVIGDNRDNSADSRSEIIGAISTDSIIGKAQVRIFPFTNICILEEDN